MSVKNFTKTLGSGSAEALSTSTIFAEYEVFLQCPASNSGTMTIYNEDDQILFKLEPGTRDRFKVDKTIAPKPGGTTAREYLGDVQRVGGADVVIYKNGGFGKREPDSPPATSPETGLPLQGAGNPAAVAQFTLSSWSAQGTSGDVVYVNCR